MSRRHRQKLAIATVNSDGKPRAPYVSPELRSALIKEAGYTCQNCRHEFEERDLRIDHIYPAGRGGLNERSNFQVLCHWCNDKKRSSDARQIHRGIQLAFSFGARWTGLARLIPLRKPSKSEVDRLKREINKQAAEAA